MQVIGWIAGSIAFLGGVIDLLSMASATGPSYAGLILIGPAAAGLNHAAMAALLALFDIADDMRALRVKIGGEINLSPASPLERILQEPPPQVVPPSTQYPKVDMETEAPTELETPIIEPTGPTPSFHAPNIDPSILDRVAAEDLKRFKNRNRD